MMRNRWLSILGGLALVVASTTSAFALGSGASDVLWVLDTGGTNGAFGSPTGSAGNIMQFTGSGGQILNVAAFSISTSGTQLSNALSTAFLKQNVSDGGLGVCNSAE